MRRMDKNTEEDVLPLSDVQESLEDLCPPTVVGSSFVTARSDEWAMEDTLTDLGDVPTITFKSWMQNTHKNVGGLADLSSVRAARFSSCETSEDWRSYMQEIQFHKAPPDPSEVDSDGSGEDLSTFPVVDAKLQRVSVDVKICRYSCKI